MLALVSLALVLSAALGDSGGGAKDVGDPCPARCQCPVGISQQVICGNVSLEGKRADYVNIVCENKTLSCEDMPDFNFGDNDILNSVGLQDCPVETSLSLLCVLRALKATGVRSLTLAQAPAGLALTEHNLEGLEDLNNLILTTYNDADTFSITPAALSSLPHLTTLSLQGGRAELTSGALMTSRSLRRLEVSSAHVTSVPDGVFRALGGLTNLMLTRNQIEEISPNALQGLSSLTTLELSSNKLRSLSGVELQHTPQLAELSAFANPLRRLGVLAPLNALHKLKIFDSRANLTLAPAALANLPNLTTVDLKRCRIHTLPSDLLTNSTSLQTLNLGSNAIEELPQDIFRYQGHMKILDLSRNKLAKLSANVFNPMKHLVELNLDENKLVTLPAGLLNGLTELKSFSAAYNSLLTLSGAALSGPNALTYLSLAHNELEFGARSDKQYMFLEGASPFGAHVQLEHLDLSYNNIEQLFTDLPLVLLSLKLLDLSHNKLQDISNYANELNFLSKYNATVDLRHNNITSLELYPAYRRAPPSLPATILLDDNPFRCDCHLYDFAKRLNGYVGDASEANLVVESAVCAEPSALAGRELLSLRLTEYTCLLTDQDCVSSCNCTVKPDSKCIELMCSQFVHADYEVNALFGETPLELVLTNPPESFPTLSKYVRMLNLSGLGLEELPVGSISKSLQLLDLSQNNLTKAPMELLSTKLTMLLAGNPFACDCWRSKSVATLKLYENRIGDYNITTCSNNQLVSLVITSDLCNTLIAATIGGALALFGLLVAVVAVVMYLNSELVKAILHKLGWCRCWINEEELDKDKLYDAFVSFAHEDEDFVTENLLPGLETGSLPFKLCVHYRDWIVGEWIPAQIARSVEQSRRTIIVVSKKFLESIWGRLEFRAANMNAIRESRTRVIVVLLEDIKGHEEIDEELKAYLATNTYLQWGDPWFWEKLRYALPHRTEERHIRKAGGKLAKKLMINAGPGGLDTQLTADGKIINAAIALQKQKHIP